MSGILYPKFLEDPAEYGRAEDYWVQLWNRIDPFSRRAYQWTHPWLSTGSPHIKDGNPIFSARSRPLRRGVRVVQLEPYEEGLDIEVWLDTFGGEVDDPSTIHELVIACVLSEASAGIALPLMSQWVQNRPLSFISSGDSILLPNERDRPREIVMSLEFAA